MKINFRLILNKNLSVKENRKSEVLKYVNFVNYSMTCLFNYYELSSAIAVNYYGSAQNSGYLASSSITGVTVPEYCE